MNHQILLDYAISMIRGNHSCHVAKEDVIRGHFNRFINREISKEDVKIYIKPRAKVLAALDKLEQIINVPEEPIRYFNKNMFPFQDRMLSKRKKVNTWTEYEDVRLFAAIDRFGLNQWGKVATFVGNNRLRSQCSQRWLRVLNPTILKKEWSSNEEEKLIDLVEKYGVQSWVKIANELGGRSDVQCRYKYKQLVDLSAIGQTQEKKEPNQSNINIASVNFQGAFLASGKPLMQVRAPMMMNQGVVDNVGIFSFDDSICRDNIFDDIQF